MVQFTDRRNKVTTLTYDALDRLSFIGYGTRSGPTYESTVSNTYDAGNRLTQALDSVTGTITVNYDGLDRVTSESGPRGAVSYVYDNAGRPLQIVQGSLTHHSLGKLPEPELTHNFY